MKDYTKFMNYALFTMIDRKTQDDRRSKIKVEALFSNPCQADNYNAPNKEIKRYLLRLEDLEEFERFYNFIQDINEKYGDHAIFHPLYQQPISCLSPIAFGFIMYDRFNSDSSNCCFNRLTFFFSSMFSFSTAMSLQLSRCSHFVSSE